MLTVRRYQRSGRQGWEVDFAFVFEGRKYRRRRKSPHPSKEMTKRWAQRQLAHWLSHGPNESKEISPSAGGTMISAPLVRVHAEVYRAAMAGRGWKPSSLAALESMFRVHINEAIGDVPIDEIGPRHIAELRRALRKLSPKTQNNVLAALSGMLRYAKDEEEIIESTPRIRLNRLPSREAEFVSPGVLVEIVAAARRVGHREELVILLGAHGGLRGGEMAALRHSDLRFADDRGRITISRTLWRGSIGAEEPRRTHEHDLKGGHFRSVPMTSALRAALIALPRPLRDDQRILRRTDGRDVTAKWLISAVRRVEREAGLDVTGRVHILRHTYCTHLRMAGATLDEIQVLAGHESLTTTRRYVHHAPGPSDEAVARLDAFGTMMEQAAAEKKKPRQRAR